MNTQVISPSRVRWISIALILFCIVGTATTTQRLVVHDQKNQKQEIFDRGNSLVSLIALHSLSDFKNNKREFFLRTLSDYVISEGLSYCLIHDSSGKPLLSLAPKEVVSEIPEEVTTRALYGAGATQQSFNLNTSEYPIYEFSKPIFEQGKKTGTVRLGFNLSPVEILSSERISLIATITFFILATGIFVYYGMALALRPLRDRFIRLLQNEPSSSPGTTKPHNMNGFLPITRDLEKALFQIRETLREAEEENADMASRVGISLFENNQVNRIIDCINFGFITTDIQDNIHYINASMLSLFKIERQDAVDKPLHDILDNDDIASFIAQHESLKSTSSIGHIETTFPKLAPDEIFHVGLSFLKDNEEAVSGKIISIKNVTREKSAEKTQHEFIANIAHEFLTPLTTINSYNEMLMDGEVEDREMQKEFFNTISEETDRLSRVIQTLLNMSKIELGSLTLERGFVKTDWLVDDSYAAVEKAAQSKNIAIKKVLPDKFPTLVGDKELLKTAIINLLGNAVKYCHENGSITLSLSEREDQLVFDVIDTGHGISEEDLPHIFEKFYRSREPFIKEQKGSGLGLAMTSEIIQLHGGDIEVESELNKGTHFSVTLPKEEYYLGEQ